MSKRCKACCQDFQPHPQVPHQNYCSDPECQRERRRRWQQEKRQTDPDYRDNDARHGKDWAAENPDYWRRYREAHPDYAERNRSLQLDRNQKHREATIANEDVSTLTAPLPSGRYRLVPVTADGIANGDAWIVEIAVLSSDSAAEDA
ncbi:hypothetical protein Q3O93_02965 [Ralstonia pseudosolanacearum]|uniref:hypothetical protein n=1 Tax=Ralstonia pseudosolanacearum TaxID=1310165 RepID=UPI0026750E06|nr:hypothetical protein [Ralstonia pseudosolanacearum]MDO3530877.1 hypothetical protein [Ralstonia pseudosolanacearum]